MMLTRIIASGINAQAPDWGLWQADGAGSRPGLIRVRRPHWPEGKAIEIPASGVDSDPGMPIPVRHHNRNRQLPYSSHKLVSARGKLVTSLIPSLLLSPWSQAEGNPYSNRGPVQSMAPPTWSGAVSIIGSMPRYYYADELHVAPGSGTPDLAAMLSFEGVVITDDRVAAMACLYNGDGSAIIGYLVREWDPTDSSLTNEWIHLSGSTIGTLASVGQMRRQGYFWHDKTSGHYTVAAHDGLLLCTAANAPTPTLCAWAHSYGDIPPNSAVSVAGGYALQGALHECDLAFDPASLHAVDCYARGETAWTHVAQVVLGDKLDGVDYYQPVGQWDPFTEGINPENSRWPYLPATAEWLIWLSGRAGEAYPPTPGPTLAKAALIAIKAATGAVRLIGEYEGPLLKYQLYAGQQAEFEARLAYQSEVHLENWRPLGEGILPFVDDQHPQGWSSGPVMSSLELSSMILSETIPPGDVPDEGYHIAAQRIIEFGTWTDEWGPTAAPDSQRLECGNLGESAAFPRGVVRNGVCYVPVQHGYYVAGEEPDTGPDATYSYNGFIDFPPGTIPYPEYDLPFRVFKFTRSANGGFGYTDSGSRLLIRKYNSAVLLETCDLTREFERVEGGKTYTDRRKPDLWEMGAAGDYLWLLASDWVDASEQKLALILVNATSMVELTQIWLEPDTGWSWHAVSGRPQLVVGSDGSGPWAQVTAWWTDGSTPTWYVQNLRYVSSALTKTTVVSSASPSNLPGLYTESVNQALDSGRQLWLAGGTDLERRQ